MSCDMRIFVTSCSSDNGIRRSQFIPEVIINHKIDIANFSYLTYAKRTTRSDGILPQRQVKISYKLKLCIIGRVF